MSARERALDLAPVRRDDVATDGGQRSGPAEPRSSIADHRWLVAIVAFLAAVVALGLSYLRPDDFRSTARVLVRPVGDPSIESVNLQTERELASSTPVAELAAEVLGRDSSFDPQELLPGLTVEAVVDTEILEFSYTDDAPHVARARAQAFAEAYLAFREQIEQETLTPQLERIQAEIATLEERLAGVDQRIEATDDDAQMARLQSEASAILDLLLAKQLELDELAEARPAGEIVQPATLPGVAQGPNHLATAGVGLVLGLIAGIGLAELRSRREGRRLTADDLETSLGAPVLGTIPRLGSLRGRALVDATDARGPGAEAYRILRTNVMAAVQATGARSLVVTSAEPGEGKTLTATNLALVVAAAGWRVVLIDADGGEDGLGGLLHVPASPGLTDVLVRGVPVSDVVRTVDRSRSRTHARVVSGGRPVEDAARLLGSRRMSETLSSLAAPDAADLVVVDAAPILGTADGVALAPVADAVLIVVDDRHASVATLERVRKQLDRLNVRVLGIVWNRGRG